MRNLFTAMLIALVTFLFSAQSVAAQYPPEIVNFMTEFVNGGSPVGNIDIETNCRPSGEKRNTLFSVNEWGLTGTSAASD